MEAQFIQLLLSDLAISGIVGDRVFPARRPQGSAFPALVATRISGQPLYVDEGKAGLVNARMQVDCYAEDYTTTKDLARAVDTLLSAYSGVFGGVNFSYIMLDEERDLNETGANQAEYLYRVAMDFIVWVRG